MGAPLRITFAGIKARPALADLIREEASKLQEFFDHILDCHVVVDVPHRHHRKGNHVRVRLELSVPHDLLVVARDPPLHADSTFGVRVLRRRE